MKSRFLVAYDRSALADFAVEGGLRLAQEAQAPIYVLGLWDESAERVSGWGLSAQDRLHEDLISIFHLGQRLGVDVDSSVLTQPTVRDVREVMRTKNISRVVVARIRDDDRLHDHWGRVLESAAEAEKIPVTMLSTDGAD